MTTDEHPFCVEGKGVSRVVNLLVPAVLACIALALYLTRLDTPPVYLYDESYHAYTASQYAAGNPDAFVWDTIAPAPGVAYTWNHPPVGLLLISLGIRALGDGPLGWRVMSALFGAAGISLAYVLGRTLTRSSLVGLLTSVLLLLDGLYFVQSRTAMLDVFGTVFTMGGLLAFYLHLTSQARRAPLLLTGLLMGLPGSGNGPHQAVVVESWREGGRPGLWDRARSSVRVLLPGMVRTSPYQARTRDAHVAG